jgi:hypothetical protein
LYSICGLPAEEPEYRATSCLDRYRFHVSGLSRNGNSSCQNRCSYEGRAYSNTEANVDPNTEANCGTDTRSNANPDAKANPASCSEANATACAKRGKWEPLGLYV